MEKIEKIEKMKNCPFCGEEILEIAIKCKYCQEWLSEKDENPLKNKVQCSICAEDVDEDLKICPYCHEEINNQLLIEVETKKSNIEFESTPMTSYTSNRDKKLNTNAKQQGFFEFYFYDTFIRHYSDFKGKISRKQFWYGTLCLLILVATLQMISILNNPIFLVIAFIMYLAIIIPTIGYCVRRLHDIGRSGWWYLIGFIPLFGPIYLLFLWSQKGSTMDEVQVKHNRLDYIIWACCFLILAFFIFVLTS